MNLVKKAIALLFFITFINTQGASNNENPSLEKIIEISPSALDVIINSFDNVVIYFHQTYSNSQLHQVLQRFQTIKNRIRDEFPSDHTLFGYVNITEDYEHRLERFGNNQGFKILNRFIPQETFKDREEELTLFKAYQILAHPRLPLAYSSQALKYSANKFNLLYKFKTTQKLREYNQIYEKAKYYLQDLQIGSYAVPAENMDTETIVLFKEEEVIESYRFNNLTNAEIASDLIQQVNIDTLPVVSSLHNDNIHRVFGGSISDQLLLLYKDSIDHYDLTKVRKIVEEAAIFNKQQQLTYERVIFAEISEQFFEEQFNQQSLNIFKQAGDGSDKFAIMFIKTDYDRFNLKKYILKLESELRPQNIISFIEDVRMKRLEPQYKSQNIPSQKENNKTLRKIVGNSFISEVYQKPDQSIVILFIDSKDQQSYAEIKKQLQNFADKHKKEFEGTLNFGIFDLAKNEHKLLYFKQAPQIVLFDRANKKQTKYYKMGQGVSMDLLQKWLNSQLSSSRLQKLADDL